MSALRLLGGVWSRRALLTALVYRTFHVRYRQSMIGIVWSFLPTIGTLLSATLIFKGVAKVETDIPYPVFAMSALVPWSFLSSSLNSGIASIAGAGLIGKVSFPRAVLPLREMGLSLVDMGISFLVFVGFLAAQGEVLPWTSVFFVPLFAIEVLLVAGIVLLFSAMNAFARDIRLGVPTVVGLWLFLTPVLYPLDAAPEALRGLYELNPMTGLIVGFRACLAEGQVPDFSLAVPAIVAGVGFFLIGSWYFTATERRFADVL